MHLFLFWAMGLMGDGPDRQTLEAKSEDMGLKQKTRIYGMVPNDEVYKHMADSDILILPSFYEGLPIVLLEAMACGCVPVASRLKLITDDPVESGKNGILVEPGDVENFVNGIVSINNDHLFWKQMSSAAQSAIEQRFSVDLMGRAYLDLIREALSGGYALPRSRKSKQPAQIEKCGSVLLSHPLTRAVPSALEGLTTVFGMGTGVAPPLSPPQFNIRRHGTNHLSSPWEWQLYSSGLAGMTALILLYPSPPHPRPPTGKGNHLF
jgi:hypothetical protein